MVKKNQIVFEIGGMMKETMTSNILSEEIKYLNKTFPDKIGKEIFIETIDGDKNKVIIDFSDVDLFDKLVNDMKGRGFKMAMRSFRIMGIKMIFIRADKETKV